MESYTGFAKVYDLFMDNIPYEEWGSYLIKMLKKYGACDGIVLDLGCGTGNMTELLWRNGYDMIGVDASEQMLGIAMERQEQAGSDILYLRQDMREFELYGTVKAVVSVCDCVNYITEPEELLEVFRLVNNYLDPGGIFIFDFNTEYKYKYLLKDQVFAEDREQSSFIWQNFYDEEEKINQYDLTLFIREEEDLYRKYEETHFQRAYTAEEITKLVEKAGLELLAVYDAFTEQAPSHESERVYIIAREKMKQRCENV